MRYGYSLLLREFLEAEEVDFGDCEQFQITCPACREPVFKKTRQRPDGEATHFLSHYRAETEDEKDCELRVDSIAREYLEPFNAEGRNQTLSGFLAVLREAIIDGQSVVFPREMFRQNVMRLLSRPVFDDFVVYPQEALSSVQKMPNPRRLVADMLAGFPRFADRSPFWHRRQAAYIMDVIAHLMTPKARQNMRFLAAAAYVHIGLKADEYRRNSDTLRVADIAYDPLPAVILIEALVKGKSQAALHKIAARASGANRATSKEEAARCVHRLHQGIVGELIGPMVGLLAAIPFPDLARRRAQVKDEVDAALRELVERMTKIFEASDESGRQR